MIGLLASISHRTSGLHVLVEYFLPGGENPWESLLNLMTTRGDD